MLFSRLFQEVLSPALSVVWNTFVLLWDFYYIWLPIILLVTFWNYWKRYVVAEALAKEETLLIQVKIPREMSKSPKAMELFLQNLYNTGGEGNFYKKYWKGGTRPWFSLELVSIEGQIRFYIWTRKSQAKLIETQLYSQFPNIEVIVDAPDYTKRTKFDPSTNDLFGLRFGLTKDDPYPIKTYIDFGLDQDPKEEFKVDPIAATMEYLGSIGKGEQIWIQIIIRAHKKFEKKSFLDKFTKFFSRFFAPRGGYKNWEAEGKAIAEKLRLEGAPNDETEIEKRKIRLTKQQEAVIQAVERSITKPGFDTAIRAIYIAEKDNFDKSHLGSLRNAFKQFSSDGLNGFKPLGSKTFSNDNETTDFDYPWQDLTGKKLLQRKMEIFNNYIKRARFSTRYNVDDFILNTEELATIFHFPSSVIETPNLPRIDSKKSEPPPNIPI